MERAKLYAQHRLEIFRLYITDGRTRGQAKLEFERRGLAPEPRLTTDQWNELLRNLRIFKNLQDKEAAIIYEKLCQTPANSTCLLFAGDVLLNNEKIAGRYRGRLEPSLEYHHDHCDRRNIDWMYLPFRLTILGDPDVFKNFQQLLFTTRVLFESSFDNGIWAPNDQGLYARSPDLRSQLTQLSRLHNLVSDAIKQFRAGGYDRGRAQLMAASQLHEPVVRSRHHRQLPDLLAILLMIWRSGDQQLQESMVEDLSCKAAQVLSPNDPRRIMFSCLTKFGLDQICHLYLSFDAYCRHMWTARVTHDKIKAYYSYNQASFPRADVGEFYSLYKGMALQSIQNVLKEVDQELGLDSTENFCLWHTAMQYLWNEKRYLEMGFIGQHLRKRIDELGVESDDAEDNQLNVDAAMTFYLLGQAEESLGCLLTARDTFARSVRLRNRVRPPNMWDATRGIALTKLVSLDTRIGNVWAANNNTVFIDRMYS